MLIERRKVDADLGSPVIAVALLARGAASPLRRSFGRLEDGRASGLESEPQGRRRAN